MKQAEKEPGAISCPCCGAAGQPVKPVTLRALLKPESAAQVREENSYFFCDAFCGAAACEVVYFAPGSQIFLKADLTVRVGSKESASPRQLCYCFGHTIESIAEEIERTGRSTAVADIRRRMREGGCACETKNPAGRCCLAAVEQFVREQLASSGQEAEVAKPQAGGGC
jgi:hypothetical protein